MTTKDPAGPIPVSASHVGSVWYLDLGLSIEISLRWLQHNKYKNNRGKVDTKLRTK